MNDRYIKRLLRSHKEEEYTVSLCTQGYYSSSKIPAYVAFLSYNFNKEEYRRDFVKHCRNKIWDSHKKKKYMEFFTFPAAVGSIIEARLKDTLRNKTSYFIVIPRKRNHLKKISNRKAFDLAVKIPIWRKKFWWSQSRSVPAYIRALVFERDQGRCVNCGSNKFLEFDHIIPYSKGGATSLENIQLLCQKCNRRKYNHLFEPFSTQNQYINQNSILEKSKIRRRNKFYVR